MAKDADAPFQYGGQAVIEGVMMRGPRAVAVAVRVGDEILVERKEYLPWAESFPFLKWPLIRGTAVLVESLVLGMRALNLSASLIAGEEEGEGLSPFELGLAVAVALGLTVVLFILLPAWVGHLTRFWLGAWGQNTIEGVTRLGIFLAYLVAIGCFQEIRRYFQYHGAEHMVINTFEEGAGLTVAEAAKRSPLHPSCGTSFLLVVLVVSIFVFALLGNGPWWWKFGARLLLLPLVAGLGYEFIRYARRHRRGLGALILPGLWLQKLTTGQPDADQLEVAILAFQNVLPKDE
ncbi:MAG: DUF1385 domain-containing protein [Bacillota bacterium]|nr:DUF1385 domain-containing protein [Bacillota bacterium]